MAALGQGNEAIESLEKAVQLFEQLWSANPLAFEKPTASAWTTLAGALIDAGRFDEALARSARAIEVQRRVLEAGDKEVCAGLAQSLRALAAALVGLGQKSTARPLLNEAVEIHRQLAAESPELFEGELALSCRMLEELDSVDYSA